MSIVTHDRRPIRWWERTLVALFGLVLVGIHAAAPALLGRFLLVAGWVIVAAAVGVVELAMALYYRARRGR